MMLSIDHTICRGYVRPCKRRHCWVDSANINAGWAPKSFCVADEHYMPTLLASLGKENETDCAVRSTYTQH